MDFINISDWNEKIEASFREAKTQLPTYEKELKTIVTVLSKSLNTEERLTLEKRAKELKDVIDDLLNDTSLGFYLLEAHNFLEQFSKIDKKEATPFMKKDRVVTNESRELSAAFLTLIKRYNNILNLDIPTITSSHKNTIVCKCGNTKDFDIIDNRLFYCQKCGVQIKENMGTKSTYKDIDRINVSSKYKYTRMIHIRNCVRQYQGKQKVRIPLQCIKDIKDQLELNGNVKKVNPQHIRSALQETGWSDQYENFVLIWSMITSKECPDISFLEDQIYRDFEHIEREYNIIMGSSQEERSSFMSYPYVLYQIITRHGIKCDLNFFNMLKSNCITWLDDTMEQIYFRLEWGGFCRLGG